jgi:3'-phosphoadenosine 5'-phosphosulfate sulfotransferase (PAPS reductase)/FAD synthetase
MLTITDCGDVLPVEPTINQFDVYHIGLSGGKDSTALALWCWFESGLPRERMRFVFCDTGNEDALTYAFLDYLAEFLPIVSIVPQFSEHDKARYQSIHADDPEPTVMTFYNLARYKQMFPSKRRQFCTQYLKLIPSREDILTLQRREREVCRMIGIRHDEGHSGNDRAEHPLWQFDDVVYCWKYCPLINWSIDDVWGIHRRYLSIDRVCRLITDDPTMQGEQKAQLVERMRSSGIPRNPLYEMGARRVGCFPCVNSRKDEVRAMVKYRPERIEFIAGMEPYVSESSTFFSSYICPLALEK